MSQWICNDCGHQFTNKDDMKDHININHDEDSKKSESYLFEAPEVDEAKLYEWIAKATAAEN